MKKTLAFASLALLAPLVSADKHSARVPLLPKYQQECSSCHIAHPPQMLSASSWQRLIDNLPRHFGTDASLDPATARDLSAWLGASAGRGRRISDAPPEDRITRSSWFVREHRELGTGIWRHASVRSAGNCDACHGGAARGDFDEDSVRIPK